MRKLKADVIFTLNGPPVKNGIVVLDDLGFVLDVLDESGFVPDFLNGVLDDPGFVLDVQEDGQDGDDQMNDVEVFKGVIVPGFVNAHCHLELSHLKEMIPSGQGLVNFILSVQSLRQMPDEVIQTEMLKAESQMQAEGIVAIGDISNSAASFHLKAGSKLEYHTFIESFSFTPSRAAASLENALKLKEQYVKAFKDNSAKVAKVSITPHAPYSVSKDLFQLISEHEQGILSIHNQESEAENEFFIGGKGNFQNLYARFGITIDFYKPFGARSLPTYIGWLGNQKKLLVHNTFSSTSDFTSISNKEGMALCLCPKANLYIEGSLPDLAMLQNTGLPLLMGTDSLASNNSLSMIDEMRVIQNNYPQITLETMLSWACLNAARFFNWPALGSIQKGKKPGIVLIENLGKNQEITKETKSRRIA